MLEFTDYIYIGLYFLVILVLKEIIEYVFITRRGGNVINIEDTVSNTKTNEIGTNTRFKKKRGGKDDKVIEGLAACPTPSSIDDLSGPISGASSPIANCDRATWLFCDTNFDKLMCLIKAITIERYGESVMDEENSDAPLEGIIKSINFTDTVYLTKGLEISGKLHQIRKTTDSKKSTSQYYCRIFGENGKTAPYLACRQGSVGLTPMVVWEAITSRRHDNNMEF